LFNRDQITPLFPLGSDFTEQEQVLLQALLCIKRKSQNKLWLLQQLLAALWFSPDEQQQSYLERMGLAKPAGLKQRFYARMLAKEIAGLT